LQLAAIPAHANGPVVLPPPLPALPPVADVPPALVPPTEVEPPAELPPVAVDPPVAEEPPLPPDEEPPVPVGLLASLLEQADNAAAPHANTDTNPINPAFEAT